ncbi:hypothetical protein GpartN1_g7355.t1 [Galdieria partita]|uniref:Uncharacterized protein n=1 Tax=Galdieria partita TaxID=83374 RepID=A0A9C7UTP1_9RHOD|nr:hypothetical protein GpartN1_g7355.t1 [Galdieria partita]
MSLCQLSAFGYRLGFAIRLTCFYSAIFTTVFSITRVWVYRARFLSSLLTNLSPIRVEFDDIKVNWNTDTLQLANLRLSLKEHGIRRSLFGTCSTPVDLFFANAVQVSLNNRKRDLLGTWWRNNRLNHKGKQRRHPLDKLEFFVDLENPRLYLEFDDIALMQSNWRSLSQALASFRDMFFKGLSNMPLGRKSLEQASRPNKGKVTKFPVDWEIRNITVQGTAVLQVRSKLMGGMKLVDDIYLSPTYFYQHRAMSLSRWIDQLEQIAMERVLSGDWTKAFEKMPQSFRNSLKTTAAQFLGTTEQVADVLLGDVRVAETIQNAIVQVARTRLEDMVTSFLYQQKLWQRSSYSRIRFQAKTVTEWKMSAVFLFR